MRYPALAIALFLSTAFPPAAVAGGVTYKYREDDGTVWYTDRRPSGADFDEYQFLGYHGRPPASASCRGMTHGLLEKRAHRVETPMHRIASHYGVDELLVKAIISVESCFDPKAVSSVGARGLMQLMPRTARRMGVTDVFDVRQNLRGGIVYFRQLHQRYEGDTRLALAAYNAGPGAVAHYDGIPPYAETQRYVRRVLTRWHAYRALAGN